MRKRVQKIHFAKSSRSTTTRSMIKLCRLKRKSALHVQPAVHVQPVPHRRRGVHEAGAEVAVADEAPLRGRAWPGHRKADTARFLRGKVCVRRHSSDSSENVTAGGSLSGPDQAGVTHGREDLKEKKPKTKLRRDLG